MAADLVAQEQRALSVAHARIAELERALAFERSEREKCTARIMEMGHVMIGAQNRVAALQAEVASKESTVREQLREELRARIIPQADMACELSLRDLNNMIGDGRHPIAPRTLGPRQVVELRELIMAAFEEARAIARRGL